MLSRLVISNTSPLFYLHQINRLDLLQTLYGQITVPAAVQRELQAGQAQGLSVPPVETLGWVTLAAAKARWISAIAASMSSFAFPQHSGLFGGVYAINKL